MEVNIIMPCWRGSGGNIHETEAGFGWREADAQQPVPFERDVQALPGFSNAKVLLEECEE
jgi:hypothetical protein